MNVPDWHFTLARGIAGPVPLFRHGTMTLEAYAPEGEDRQRPHAQDELYIVARGHGRFRCGGARHAFGGGDALFVPAGMEHRFEEFGEDFATWVVFWGPDGGEKGEASPPGPPWRWSVGDGLAAPIPEGQRSARLFRHASAQLRLYAPPGVDRQVPHGQDEIYVVASGRARFAAGRGTWDVAQGDALFVPAGVEHRFLDIGTGFAVWVLFYGPEGGEADGRPELPI